MNRFRYWLIRALGGELPAKLVDEQPRLFAPPIRTFVVTSILPRDFAEGFGEDENVAEFQWRRAKEELFMSKEIDQLLQKRVMTGPDGCCFYRIKIALVDANGENVI